MAPLQTNATVTAVAAEGSAPDWNRAGAAGGQEWAGAERAYYRETTVTVDQGGDDTRSVRRTLILSTASAPMLVLDPGDLVTFTPDGAGAMVGTVGDVARAELAGMPDELQTSRVELQSAIAADRA